MIHPLCVISFCSFFCVEFVEFVFYHFQVPNQKLYLCAVFWPPFHCLPNQKEKTWCRILFRFRCKVTASFSSSQAQAKIWPKVAMNGAELLRSLFLNHDESSKGWLILKCNSFLALGQFCRICSVFRFICELLVELISPSEASSASS